MPLRFSTDDGPAYRGIEDDLHSMERKLRHMMIRLEETKDYREVENLTREAFCVNFAS